MLEVILQVILSSYLEASKKESQRLLYKGCPTALHLLPQIISPNIEEIYLLTIQCAGVHGFISSTKQMITQLQDG